MYWKRVGKENNRLLNKIFKIDNGKIVEPTPVTMQARSRSASPLRCCALKQKDSTYFNTYGRSCKQSRNSKEAELVEVKNIS